MEEGIIQLTEQMKKLILLVDKKNRLNSARKNAQWRAAYYRDIHYRKRQNMSNLPKKWENNTLSDINLLVLKNEAEVLKSRIKILNFNKKFSDKIDRICEKEEVRKHYDAGNFISLVVFATMPTFRSVLKTLSVRDIRKIAKEYESTLAVEKMLTKE